MFTPEYFQLIGNENISSNHRACIEDFLKKLISSNPGNIETVILYGGLVRDARSFDSWSDIDVIVIFQDIVARSTASLSVILHQLSSAYSVRIDLTQLSLKDLTDECLVNVCYNGEVINALSIRDNVSIALFGKAPRVTFTLEQEQQAAVFYLVNTLSLLRRYFVEVVYKNGFQNTDYNDIMRIVRWTFSIIRASLRLFNIFEHPYEYSLPHLRQHFPNLNTSVLSQLIEIRKDVTKISFTPDLAREVELFVEVYVSLVLHRYYNGDETHK